MVWGDILPFWGLFYLLGDFGEHFAFNFVNYYLYLLKRLLFDILLRDMYKVRKKQTNLTERCVLLYYDSFLFKLIECKNVLTSLFSPVQPSANCVWVTVTSAASVPPARFSVATKLGEEIGDR